MSDKSSNLVVILHGIGMSTMRMAYIDFRLRRAGYTTLNIGYPSLRRDIEGCADFVRDKIIKGLKPHHTKIHFVAHSMGCLVALELISKNYFPQATQAVMIAPPYRGSEVADLLQRWRLYKFFFGPAGLQLTTDYRKNISFSLPTTVQMGVIAGTRAYEYPFFLRTMKKTGAHDGLISVESTRIPGAKEHITIRMSHSFLLEKSALQTIHFLIHGRFMPTGE